MERKRFLATAATLYVLLSSIMLQSCGSDSSSPGISSPFSISLSQATLPINFRAESQDILTCTLPTYSIGVTEERTITYTENCRDLVLSAQQYLVNNQDFSSLHDTINDGDVFTYTGTRFDAAQYIPCEYGDAGSSVYMNITSGKKSAHLAWCAGTILPSALQDVYSMLQSVVTQ